MASDPRAQHTAEAERVTREIAIQAELLALNIALEGKGAGQASEALYSLSRELGRAGARGPVPVPRESAY
jgi:hypothetical protein